MCHVLEEERVGRVEKYHQRFRNDAERDRRSGLRAVSPDGIHNACVWTLPVSMRRAAALGHDARLLAGSEPRRRPLGQGGAHDVVQLGDPRGVPIDRSRPLAMSGLTPYMAAA
jgi:hypothetical protein